MADFGSITTLLAANFTTPFTSLLRTHEPLSPSPNKYLEVVVIV